jgi:hypothetical protein
MTTLQPWQDEPDPRCDRCGDVTPYGEWIADLPAKYVWPESEKHEWGDYPVGSYLCFMCIDQLGGHHDGR